MGKHRSEEMSGSDPGKCFASNFVNCRSCSMCTCSCSGHPGLATTGRSEANFLSTSVRRPRRLKSLELRNKVMRKDFQEALENAIAGFEQRQQAEQERLHERERFDSWLKSVLRR